MENNGTGKRLNREGWYKHRETGVRQYLTVTPDIGTPMIDAYVQVGFVYDEDQSDGPKVVSDVKKENVLTCEVCGKECKNEFGLQSHMRAHK
jgi:hypothetical protein